MVALKQGSVPDVIANKLDHLLILTSGTEQYLITCTNKKYKFLLTTTLTISETHMWPLTITQLPRCREACLVCLADKMSSSWETLMERRAKREASHAARS